MAFTGTANVVQISDSMIRITGLSLAGSGASGIIGLSDHTGAAVDVALPASFQPKNYVHGSTTISLSDMLDVSTNPATSVADSRPPSVIKSGTTTPTWRCTLANAFASATTGLEIYIKLHQ
jgi:hypothetical protein